MSGGGTVSSRWEWEDRVLVWGSFRIFENGIGDGYEIFLCGGDKELFKWNWCIELNSQRIAKFIK